MHMMLEIRRQPYFSDLGWEREQGRKNVKLVRD